MASWGTRRKILIISTIVLIILILIGIAAALLTYKAPSCTDGKQNQGEQGIDCGGPCPDACVASETPLKVEFVRALSPSSGRTDIVAYVNNVNANAGLDNAKATIQLYNAYGALIIERSMDITVPPSSVVPIFIPDFYTGTQKVAQAYLTVDPATVVWLRTMGSPVTVKSSDIIPTNLSTSPKITATLTNTSAHELDNLKAVVVVSDPTGNVIAASQTVVSVLPALGTAPVVFTWNEPFSGVAANVAILAVPQV